MNRRAIAKMACVSAASPLLVACCLLDSPPAAVQALRPANPPQPVGHIGQRGFGWDAYFARCPGSSCLAVTSKVLAARREASPAAMPTGDLPAVPLPSPLAASPPDSLPEFQKTTSASPAAADRLTLHFRANAARLTADHKARLGEALRELRTSDLIVISGRTDDLGSESVNEALALARGLAVRDHLLDLDPALPARIAIDARGRCCYAAANNSIAGRASNRRVEVAYRQADREMP